MSILLKNSDAAPATPTSERVHFIPARLNKDSAADVDKYFDQFTEAQSSDILTNALRGRPMIGAKMDIPEGWVGAVYSERKRPLTDDVERVFHQKTTFDSLTYWNYDKNPSRNDAFTQALQWLEISDVLHAPEKPTAE